MPHKRGTFSFICWVTIHTMILGKEKISAARVMLENTVPVRLAARVTVKQTYSAVSISVSIYMP